MSVHVKRALVIVLALAALAIDRVISGGITATGSGGLAAVSFGLSEVLIEVVILAVVIAALAYGSWWQRQQSS